MMFDNITGSIGPIRSPVNMVSKGETMPGRYKWIDQTGRSGWNGFSGLSDQSGHRDRSVRRSLNGPVATRLTRLLFVWVCSGAGIDSAPLPFRGQSQ